MLLLIIAILFGTFYLLKRIGDGGAMRFFFINVLIILIYNLAGWSYIFQFLDVGGASLGPGMLLIFITLLHLIILFLIGMVRMSRRSQANNYKK